MADNPIKGTDLIDIKSVRDVVDETIALNEKLSDVLVKNAEILLKTTQAINKSRTNSVEALQKEEDATEKLTKEVEENEQANKELLKIKKQLEKSTDEEVKGRIRLQKATKLQRDILKDQLVLQDKEAGTLQKLAASNRVLRREREKLNTETSDGRKRLLEINSALDANNDKIKENSDQLKKQKLNVGNYKDEVKDALKESGFFAQQISILTDIQTKFNSILRITGVTAKGTSKGFKILRVALISTGIGAIVVALGSLIAFLTQTKRGSEELAKGMAFLKGGLQVISGLVVKLGEFLFNAFSNPKEALIDFADTLKEFVIKRVEEFISGIKGLGSAITLLFQGEFTKAMEKAGEASLDLLTATNPLAAVIRDNAEAIGDLVDEIDKEATAAFELEKRIIALRDATRGVRLEIAKLSAEEQNNRAIADDATRSFAEREEAAERARKASEARAAAELDLVRQELAIINERTRASEAAGLISDDLLDEQLAANEALIQSENELTLVIRENEKQRNELRQDRLERDLDFLLDIFDNQKTINEQIIADETKTFAVRQMLLTETIRLGKKSFEEQAAIIEEFAGQSIDFNSLIAESDAKVVQERIRALGLSEIVEGRALEIIRDRKSAIQDLTVAEEELAVARQEQIDENLQEELDSITKFTEEQLKIRETALLQAGKTVEEIQEELTEARLSLLTQEAIQLKELGEDTIDQELEIAKLRVQLDKEANEEILAQRKALNSLIKDQSIALAENITDTAIDINSQLKDEELNAEAEKIEKENELLDEQVAQGLKTQEQADAIKESREEQFRAKEAQIKTQQARAEKNNEIFKATIAGIRAVIEAGGLTPLGIATGIFNAANIALLAARPLPKFKDGGLYDPETGMIGGKSHAAGGTKFYDQHGHALFEAQKGEKLFILNDKSVPFYDWMNSHNESDIPSNEGMSDHRLLAQMKKNKPTNIRDQYAIADYTAKQTAKHINDKPYYDNRYR